jgi:hypothetical protein
MKYFSYHPVDGFALHNTPEQAKHTANASLQLDREESDGEWAEWVSEVCWGEVTQIVKQTASRPRTENDIYAPDGCHTIIDYDFVDVDES